MSRPVRVAWLYPTDMSTYGDTGNVLAVTHHLTALGFTPVVDRCDPGVAPRDDVDLVLGGGGQDSGQVRIEEDLLARGPQLIDLALAGVPMLVVCGLYQMFGRRIRTASGAELTGIGLLDMETHAEPGRLVGNVRVRTTDLGVLVGYENHSGRTVLGPGLAPLGQVEMGGGNNGRDGAEGARSHHVVGTYLHGPVLPLNPALAEALVTQAVRHRYGSAPHADVEPAPWVDLARRAALRRRR